MGNRMGRLTKKLRDWTELRVAIAADRRKERGAEEALAQQAIARYHTEKAMAEERRIKRGQKSIQQMIAEIDARMTDEMLDRQARVRGYIDVSAIRAHPWYRHAPRRAE